MCLSETFLKDYVTEHMNEDDANEQHELCTLEGKVHN